VVAGGVWWECSSGKSLLCAAALGDVGWEMRGMGPGIGVGGRGFIMGDFRDGIWLMADDWNVVHQDRTFANMPKRYRWLEF
jgi:hypothetical protein